MNEPKIAPATLVHSFVADEVAMAALRDGQSYATAATARLCDLCGSVIEGEPVGSGLLVWARGEELRRDEPPLCAQCAASLSILAVTEPGDDGGEDEA